ncbi:ELM1/GtrOC1 family putative glycosyltransferase [Marinobacter sp. JSM 1782161]|uniref:ELM1/GtrOC1 family putative glycosyltransferase n=1 Tax=Marinobacter sp. JSM 1782161 TaxID=2685906 RepID=UPI0014041418|nr:ELM1/GtrOC1 family putative glycosyltransferase [Marinobacter sp. JSM 1782161]
MSERAPPIVWCLHDDRPGHQNQLRGLANRLQALAGARVYWIDASAIRVSRWRAWLGRAPIMPDPELESPDWIVAAGSGTHRLLLSLRRRARTVVLMRPGFPRRWVDYAIIPAHDEPQADDRTLVTIGALNTMTPMARLSQKRHGLMLIGGPSKHFAWNADPILDQVDRLRTGYPQWHWTVSSSRRTPEEVIVALRSRAGAHFTFRDHRDTHSLWLSHALADSRACWITPDSVSMVYESLTAGIPTGVFDLPPRDSSRVAHGVTQLLDEHRVAPFTRAPSIMTEGAAQPEPLWEADRAARWLLSQADGARP